jgi:predicted acyltransferase
MRQPDSSTALVEGLPERRPMPEGRAPSARAAPAGTGRVVSVDAYRGFTMLAMVSAGLGTAHLMQHPTWGWLARQLEHARWQGCTAWDLIQPSFMFIVGVAMPFAFARRQEQGQSWLRQFGHVCVRCVLLVLIGVFLDSYAHNAPYVQLIRVLQQIALGYFLAFLVLRAGPRVQAVTAVLLLVAHTLLFVGYGHAQGLDPWLEGGDNVGVWIDRALHRPFEGLAYATVMPLSTGGYVTLNALSSAATILFGVLGGELLRAPGSRAGKFGALVLAGVLGLGLGWALTWEVPMIKRLWTASFAVYAAGWTCLLLALFYGVIDGVGWRRWSFPFVVVGMNSIGIYVVAGVLGSNLRRAAGLFVNGPLAGQPDVRPVAVASLSVAFAWLICFWLYRRRIFFKV